MSANTHATDDHEHTTVFGYTMVFVALMVLTVITVALARVDMGLLGNALGALAVAVVKTSLVLYYFMHLKESPKIITLVAVGSFAWLGILFLFIIPDFLAMHGEGAASLPKPLSW